MITYAWHKYVWVAGDGSARANTTAIVRLDDGHAALVDPEWPNPRPFIRRHLSESELLTQLRQWPHWSSAKPSGEWSMLTPEGAAYLREHAHAPAKKPVVQRHR